MKLTDLFEAKVKVVSEKKSQDGDVMNVLVPVVKSDIRNQNGRIYKKSLLQREFAKLQTAIQKKSLIGTGDHPKSGIADIATASHLVTALSMDEQGQGWAEMRILPTDRGRNIQTLIRHDATLSVSLRGFGEVGKDGTVLDSYSLAGIDIVAQGSDPTARFSKSNIFESIEFENKGENMNEKMMGIKEADVSEIMQSCHKIYLDEGTFSGSLEEFEKENGAFVLAAILVEEGKVKDISAALRHLEKFGEIQNVPKEPVKEIQKVTPASCYLEARIAGVDPAIYAEKMNANLNQQEESVSGLNCVEIASILAEAHQSGIDVSDKDERKRIFEIHKRQKTQKVLTEDEKAEIVARKTGTTAELVKEIWEFDRKEKAKAGHYSLRVAERMDAGFGSEQRPDVRKRSRRIIDGEKE